MVEERVTVRDDGVTREETVERTHGPVVVERRGGGFGWVILLLVAIAVIAGIWFMTQMNEQGAVQTEAVTEAAKDVGNAAGDVADSIGDAVDGEKK